MYRFGEWLKENRRLSGWSQVELSEKTFGEISQPAISQYEQNRSVPSISDIDHLARAFGHTLAMVPWDAIDFGYGAKRSVTKLERRRFDLKELPQADSVRTFDGKTYELHGFIGIEKASGEAVQLTQLYYRIRTVVCDAHVLAKRKNPDDELIHVKKRKRVRQ